MNTKAASSVQSYSLADLCVLADLPPRTIRYYVQIGLVDRPDGETRAARYRATHLEQLADAPVKQTDFCRRVHGRQKRRR